MSSSGRQGNQCRHMETTCKWIKFLHSESVAAKLRSNALATPFLRILWEVRNPVYWWVCDSVTLILAYVSFDFFNAIMLSRGDSAQGRFQDVAARGGQKAQGGNIFKCNIRCMQQPPRKKSFGTCKLYSHLTRPRKLYKYGPRTSWAPPFDVLQLGQGKRQDCRRFSPLPLDSCFMSHKPQHIRRFAIQ